MGTYIFLLIRKKIAVPLQRAIGQVQNLSKGELKFDIDKTSSNNEIGILNNSLYHVVEKLKSIIGEIQVSADNLTNNSTHLSSISEELSQGAAEQASNLEEVSSTFEEISATIDQNIEKAKETGNISATVKAGVTDMINGLKYATTTTKSMNELMPEIEMSNNHIQDFVNSNIEQGNSVVQVNNSIQQMNNVTQQNASASEEMAANAEEMAAQAESLTELIKFFKL